MLTQLEILKLALHEALRECSKASSRWFKAEGKPRASRLLRELLKAQNQYDYIKYLIEKENKNND